MGKRQFAQAVPMRMHGQVQALVNDRFRPEASGGAVKGAALQMSVRGTCPLDGVHHGADAFKR